MKFNKDAFFIAMANAELDQSALAEKAGVSVSRVNDLYRGRVSPRPQTVGKLAKALGVSVEELILREEA
ncbi:MAG: helix-turn-helix transcriptional regulator [Eubacteriales bacterium]|nr:helix-turn-helix transcriptional regulator [Eubacteriales bacterium]